MANLKELRGRIDSVKNTRKITSAMSRIATARLARAQAAVLASRPYAARLREVVDHLIAGVDPSDPTSSHELLAVRPMKRVLIVAMNADKGLCGGFNANVNRATKALIDEHVEAGREVTVITLGKKARGFLTHRDYEPVQAHDAPTPDTLVDLSKAVAAASADSFLSQGSDAVFLVHNRFVSALTQTVQTVQLLPVAQPEPGSVTGPEPSFEPGRQELLDHLLPVAVEAVLQEAMFDSIAAEVAARRLAMDSATDNASELIDDLTLQYNRERQAAITSELMEIIGGSEALKG
jgi:F-type H+-transporting ATPase subunit gamma